MSEVSASTLQPNTIGVDGILLTDCIGKLHKTIQQLVFPESESPIALHNPQNLLFTLFVGFLLYLVPELIMRSVDNPEQQ